MECVWASVRIMDKTKRTKNNTDASKSGKAVSRMEVLASEHSLCLPNSSTLFSHSEASEALNLEDHTPKELTLAQCGKNQETSKDASIHDDPQGNHGRKTSVTNSFVVINTSDIDGNCRNTGLESSRSAESKRIKFHLKWKGNKNMENFNGLQITPVAQTSKLSTVVKESATVPKVALRSEEDHVESLKDYPKVKQFQVLEGNGADNTLQFEDIYSKMDNIEGLTESDVSTPKETLDAELKIDYHETGKGKTHCGASEMDGENSLQKETNFQVVNIENALQITQTKEKKHKPFSCSVSNEVDLDMCGPMLHKLHKFDGKEYNHLEDKVDKICVSDKKEETLSDTVNQGLSSESAVDKADQSDCYSTSFIDKNLEIAQKVTSTNMDKISTYHTVHEQTLNDTSKEYKSDFSFLKQDAKSGIAIGNSIMKMPVVEGRETDNKNTKETVTPGNVILEPMSSFTLIDKTSENLQHSTAGAACSSPIASTAQAFYFGATAKNKGTLSELDWSPLNMENFARNKKEPEKEIEVCDEKLKEEVVIHNESSQQFLLKLESESLTEVMKMKQGISIKESVLEKASSEEDNQKDTCEFEGFMLAKVNASECYQSHELSSLPVVQVDSKRIKIDNFVKEDPSPSSTRREKSTVSSSRLNIQVNMISLLTISGALGSKKQLLIVPRSYLTVELVMAAVNIGKFHYEDIHTWICKILRPDDRKFKEINKLQFIQYELLYRIVLENVDASMMTQWKEFLKKTLHRLPKGEGWSLIFDTVPDLFQNFIQCDKEISCINQPKSVAKHKKSKYNKSELKVSTLLKKIEVKSKHVKALRQQQTSVERELENINEEIKKNTSGIKTFIKKHSTKESVFTVDSMESNCIAEMQKVLSNLFELVLEKESATFDLQQRVADLKYAMEDKEQTIKRKNELIVKMESKIGLPFENKNEKRLRDQELHIKHLQDKLRKAKELISYKDVSNNHLKEEVRTHLLLLGEKDKIITKNWEKITDLENTIQSCRSTSGQLEHKLHGAKCALHERDIYIRSLEEQCFSINQELQTATFTLQEKMSIIQQQQSALDQYRESYDWSSYQNSYNPHCNPKEHNSYNPHCSLKEQNSYNPHCNSKEEKNLAELENRLRQYYNMVLEKEEMIKQLQKDVFEAQTLVKEKELNKPQFEPVKIICRKCSRFDNEYCKLSPNNSEMQMMQKKLLANSNLIMWKEEQILCAQKKVHELQGEVEYLLERAKVGNSTGKDMKEILELKKKNASLERCVISREEMNAQLEDKLEKLNEELECCRQKLQSKNAIVELLQNFIVDKDNNLSKVESEGIPLINNSQMTGVADTNNIKVETLVENVQQGTTCPADISISTERQDVKKEGFSKLQEAHSLTNSEIPDCDKILKRSLSKEISDASLKSSSEDPGSHVVNTVIGNAEDKVLQQHKGNDDTSKINPRDPRLQTQKYEEGKDLKASVNCSWTKTFEETESRSLEKTSFPVKISFSEYWKRKGPSTSANDLGSSLTSYDKKEQVKEAKPIISREGKKRVMPAVTVGEADQTQFKQKKRKIELKVMQPKTDIEKKQCTFYDNFREEKGTVVICKKVTDNKNPWEEIKKLRKIVDVLKAKNDKDVAKEIEERLKLQVASEKREAVLLQALKETTKLKAQLKESDVALTVIEKEREKIYQCLERSETALEDAMKAKQGVELVLKESNKSLLELQKELESLKIDMHRSSASYIQEINKYKSDLSQVEKEVEGLKYSLKEKKELYENELAASLKVIDEKEKALEDSQFENKHIRQNIKDKEEILESWIVNLDMIIISLREKSVKKKDECNKKEKKVRDGIGHSGDRLENVQDNHNERNASLNNVMKKMTVQLMSLQEEISHYREERECEYQLIKKMECEKNSLQDSLDSKQQTIKEITEENTRNELQIENLKKSLAIEIQNAKLSLNDVKKQVELKEHEAESLMKTKEKLEQEIEASQSKHLSQLLERENFWKLQLSTAQNSIEELTAAKSFLAQQLQTIDITKEQIRKELKLEISKHKIWNLDQELAKVCDLNKMLCDEKKRSLMVSRHLVEEKNRNKNLVKQLQTYKNGKNVSNTHSISRETQTTHSFEEEMKTILENSKNLQTALEAERQVSEDFYKELLLEKKKTSFLNDCLKQEYAESSKDIEYQLACITWATDRYRSRMNRMEELSSTIQEFTGNLDNP